MLVVDHLDYDKQNNAEENLMAVCHPCNSRRVREHRNQFS